VRRISDVLASAEPCDGYFVAGVIMHWCPACSTLHGFAVKQPFRNGAHWTFNGDTSTPTFMPSMNISVGAYVDDAETHREERCHYFLRNGIIEYLNDCTHAMRGQHVPLPGIPLMFPPDFVVKR
jgi:uncharacterized protein DUF6527